GNIHKDGRGVPRDDSAAVEWFRKAADRGDAWGEFNLGTMYRDGRGLQKDPALAQVWFQKAAQQGNRAAAAELSGGAAPATKGGPVTPSTQPLHLEEVVDGLQKGLPPKGMAKLVKQFGVDFTVNGDAEKSLRAAGADGDLLYAIATNKR